jgi:hypothetical protein
MTAKSRIAIAAIVSTAAASLPRLAAAEQATLEANRPAIAVVIDKAPLRIDAAQLRIAVGESIRSALAEAERAASSKRRIEVAGAAARRGGRSATFD